jgi:hypothetical protein
MKRTIISSLTVVLAAALAVAPASAGKGKPIGKTKICRATVAYVLEGQAVTVGPDSLTLTVEAANKHARPFVGQEVAVTANAATKISRDDGEATLADLVPGDALTVMIRACKDADPATLTLVAHHIEAISPAAPEQEPASEDDENL